MRITSLFIILSLLLPVKIYSQDIVLSGVVRDQDGLPINNAQVRLFNDFYGMEYNALTDKDGEYAFTMGPGNKRYFLAEVSATGYATYLLSENPIEIDGTDDISLDFTLYSVIEYHKGKCSTMVLPVPPEPSWGKFYRMASADREGNIIFERELMPKANTPYVLIPERDFQIHVADYDLSSTPERVTVAYPYEWNNGGGHHAPEATFIGVYQSNNFYDRKEVEDFYIFDETPDCYEYHYGLDEGIRVGACHCYLKLYLYLPYFVFSESLSGIEELTELDGTPLGKNKERILHDLQGRRVTGTPRPGTYIQEGRKRVVK